MLLEQQENPVPRLFVESYVIATVRGIVTVTESAMKRAQADTDVASTAENKHPLKGKEDFPCQSFSRS